MRGGLLHLINAEEYLLDVAGDGRLGLDVQRLNLLDECFLLLTLETHRVETQPQVAFAAAFGRYEFIKTGKDQCSAAPQINCYGVCFLEFFLFTGSLILYIYVK